MQDLAKKMNARHLFLNRQMWMQNTAGKPGVTLTCNTIKLVVGLNNLKQDFEAILNVRYTHKINIDGSRLMCFNCRKTISEIKQNK